MKEEENANNAFLDRVFVAFSVTNRQKLKKNPQKNANKPERKKL